jgi:hypothetical protein
MPSHRKLDLPTDQRIAVLKNLVTGLIMTGKIETTEARGKDVCLAVFNVFLLFFLSCFLNSRFLCHCSCLLTSSLR